MVSKQMIAAFISMLLGLATIFGVNIDEQIKADLINNLNAVIGGGMVVYGILMAILRKVTSTPLAAGIRGWMGVKEADK